MNTQKAAYWLALAVFGLALHSEYQQGAFPALHRAADRAGSTLCRLTAHAEQALAMARVSEGRLAQLDTDLLAGADAQDLAEAQAELLREQGQDKAEVLRGQIRAQAAMIRAQAQLHRAGIEQIHLRARSQVRFANATNRSVFVAGSGNCGKTRARVAVQTMLNLPDDDPDRF